jgi:hypothetical protein
MFFVFIHEWGHSTCRAYSSPPMWADAIELRSSVVD